MNLLESIGAGTVFFPATENPQIGDNLKPVKLVTITARNAGTHLVPEYETLTFLANELALTNIIADFQRMLDNLRANAESARFVSEPARSDDFGRRAQQDNPFGEIDEIPSNEI